jgi:dTDP-4-amino-4,6-dideoxygalactose transaminase
MILMNDFKAEPQQLRDQMLCAASRVFNSGWYVLGKEVKEFESRWAQTCGVNYGIGVGNGMDAIEIALRALDIGPGDEVITTPMTAFATVLAIIRAGATPVLADIDSDTALLSLVSVERCLTKKTRAVVLVHLYGQVRQLAAWQSLSKKFGFYLIEDCAQSHLASSNGTFAGAFGVAGTYSFYPTKNLGAPGDAGMLVTNRQDLADRAFRLRNYGQSIRYHHPELGVNSRLDELQAAILTERLKWIDQFTKRRREIANAYRQGISNAAVYLLAEPEEPLAHVYHLFVVQCQYRDFLREYLKEREIESFIHYPIPIHLQKPCRQIKRDSSGLSLSEKHANQCLSIPCHPQMSDHDIDVVIDAINTFRVR